MSRLLAVSWCMPPLIMPRAIQVSSSLRELGRLGWETEVVCVDEKSLRKSTILDRDLEEGRKGAYLTHKVRTLSESPLLRVVGRIRPATYQPDKEIVWKDVAVNMCLELHASKPFDAVATFAQPWTDHLVGLDLKKALGLPWLAHFSDPWSDSPYSAGQDQAAHRQKMEREVITNADRVVFVSEQTRQLVMRKYPPDWLDKAFVVPHGVEPFPPGADTPKVTGGNDLLLLYMGGFYGKRSPEGLLRALAEVNSRAGTPARIKLSLVGDTVRKFEPLAEKLNLGSGVSFHDQVSHTESLRLASEAHVLVVIDAPAEGESVFLPSKLMDYMAIRKPILGLTPLAGACADLLRDLDCAIAPPDDIAAIRQELEKLLELFQRGAMDVTPKFLQTAARYDIHETTKILDQILRSMIRSA